MENTFEKFCRISKLDGQEVSALRLILDNNKLMASAREIAEKAFFPGNGDVSRFSDTEAEISQAWFAAAFLSFEASRKCYNELNIPEKVWRDSMTDLRVWLRNEKRNSGTIGLGKLARPWQAKLYQGKVIRCGRLECNTEFFYKYEPLRDAAGNLLLQTNAPVINVHIPEEGPMDMKSCGTSMRQMAEFFAAFRPEYDWKGFLCESWLLDRQLRDMLPAASNIVRFQELGMRYMMHPTDDTIFRIFGTADPQSIEQPTTLQKNAAAFIKNGGTFYEEGLFIPRHKIEEADYDLERLHGK